MKKFVPAKQAPELPGELPRFRIAQSALIRFMEDKKRPRNRRKSFKAPAYMRGVIPEDQREDVKLALDDAISGLNDYWAQGGLLSNAWLEGLGFMGYPLLSEMAQRSEYRQPCEIIAEEMTRKWISIECSSTKDKTAKVKQFEEAIKHFELREKFRLALEKDGIHGQVMIYPDILDAQGNPVRDDLDELQIPLSPIKSKVRKGSLKGFQVIEASWIAPNKYDSRDPLRPDYYKPQQWFIMGKRVHISRLIHINSRPVPDILKPSYNFGGLSLMQLGKPYVENWLETRQAVNDIIKAFTVWHLATDMQAILQTQDPGTGLDTRLELFTLMKNNRGVFATDKEAEEFSNVAAPLGGLDHLQAQAQEHMASVFRIPLIKLFGITPSGLNSSTDGEIRSFYDSTHGAQERVLTDPLKFALDLIQLDTFGEIDDDLTFKFLPLYELDEVGEAAVRKTDADTDAVYITQAVISPEEVREKLSADPTSRYAGLEGPPPDPTDLMGETMGGLGSDPAERIGNEAASGQSSGANSGI